MAFQEAPATQQVAQQVAQQFAPWLPVFTFVLGQLFAIVLEWLRGIAAARRERAARDQVRKEAVEDRRAEFQRETLLSLQDALFQCELAGGRLYRAGEGETGVWSQEAAKKVAFQEDQRQVVIRISTLSERILDGDLRVLVQQALSLYFAVAEAGSKTDADTAVSALIGGSQQANERLGEVLRSLY